jgi:hypothetical protein
MGKGDKGIGAGNNQPNNDTGAARPKAGGRPSKYRPEFVSLLIEFFDREPYEDKVVETIRTKGGDLIEKRKEVPCDIPLFSTFAVKKVGVSHDTILEWCKVHPEFSEAYKKAKNLQESILVINAMRGNYEQPFSIFTSKNIMEWRDRHEILEIKFVYEFVGKVTSVINKMLPEKCPHCRKELSLRDETIQMLEQLCRTQDQVNI